MSYNSAHDLPSFVELSNQLKGLKLLGFLLPKNQRSELKRIETQLKEIADTVDDFYKLLGDRHWIFHDPLNLETIRYCTSSKYKGSSLPGTYIGIYFCGSDAIRHQG